MTDSLFLVETAEEAAAVLAYLARSDLEPSAVTIVGLGPAARALLARQGVPCLDTLPFFDNDAHARALHKSEEIAQLVERDLRPDLGDGLADVYVYAFVTHLHGRTRLMLRTLEILEGVRRAYPRATLFICSPPASPAHTMEQPKTLYHTPEWGFLASLGPRFCHQQGVSLKTLPRAATARQLGPAGSREGDTARSLGQGQGLIDRLISACYLVTFGLGSGSRSVLLAPGMPRGTVIAASVRARFPGAKVLAFRLGRGSPRAEARLALGWLLRTALRREPAGRLRSIPLDVIVEPWARDRAARAREALVRASAEFLAGNGELLAHLGVSFLDEVQEVVQHHVLPNLFPLYRQVQAERCVLERLRPALALSATSNRETRALGHLCGRKGIPALVIPEKSLRNPRNELEEIGERQMGNFHVNEAYEYVGVQSPLALGYMQSSAYDGQVIPVGPLLRWRVEAGARQWERERFFAAMGAAGKIVVYSPSASFASIFHVAQNPDEVLSSMADLAGVVAGMPGVYLVLRLHPSDAVGRGEIEALLDLPASVVVDDDSVRASFAGALALADVLVSNVSTTAEQALDNGIPVVLYDKWGRYNHLGAPVVEDGGPQALSPAYYVPARAQLGPTLRWVLERHPPGTALPASARARYTYGWDAVEGFYDFVGQMLEARP